MVASRTSARRFVPSTGTCQLIAFASDQSDSSVSVPSAFCWKKRNCFWPSTPPTAVAVTCTVAPGTVGAALVSSTASGVYSLTCEAVHASMSKSAGSWPHHANRASFMSWNSALSESFASCATSSVSAYTYTWFTRSAVSSAVSPPNAPPEMLNVSTVDDNTMVCGATLLKRAFFTPGPKYADAIKPSSVKSMESSNAPDPVMPRRIRWFGISPMNALSEMYDTFGPKSAISSGTLYRPSTRSKLFGKLMSVSDVQLLNAPVSSWRRPSGSTTFFRFVLLRNACASISTVPGATSYSSKSFVGSDKIRCLPASSVVPYPSFSPLLYPMLPYSTLWSAEYTGLSSETVSSDSSLAPVTNMEMLPVRPAPMCTFLNAEILENAPSPSVVNESGMMMAWMDELSPKH